MQVSICTKPETRLLVDTADSETAKAVHKSKKKLTRKKTKPTDDLESLRMTLRDKRKKLRREILKSKEGAWKRLCEEVDNDPQDLSYKIMTKKLKTDIPPTDDERQEAVDKLFPKRAISFKTQIQCEKPKPFTHGELEAAAKKL